MVKYFNRNPENRNLVKTRLICTFDISSRCGEVLIWQISLSIPWLKQKWKVGHVRSKSRVKRRQIKRETALLLHTFGHSVCLVSLPVLGRVVVQRIVGIRGREQTLCRC